MTTSDARGTPAPKGRDWRKALYQQIGVLSSHDWSQAVTALCAQHTWMDRSRLAIWGWSGGGAMTLNMLFRYPDLFAAGMSVAPVTDIALYDTIYQERYCGDPRQVPEVYRQCSPITFAKNLKGKLLLVHGTGDDNVHVGICRCRDGGVVPRDLGVCDLLCLFHSPRSPSARARATRPSSLCARFQPRSFSVSQTSMNLSEPTNETSFESPA
jgi:hypothetical protein